MPHVLPAYLTVYHRRVKFHMPGNPGIPSDACTMPPVHLHIQEQVAFRYFLHRLVKVLEHSAQVEVIQSKHPFGTSFHNFRLRNPPPSAWSCFVDC